MSLQLGVQRCQLYQNPPRFWGKLSFLIILWHGWSMSLIDHWAPIYQGKLHINCQLARDFWLCSMHPIILWETMLWLCTHSTYIDLGFICSSYPCVLMPYFRDRWVLQLCTHTALFNKDQGSPQVGRWPKPHSCLCNSTLFVKIHPYPFS